MHRPISAYSKAIISAVVAGAAVVAGTFPDSALGKWCVVIGAVAAALGLTAKTRNTQTVDTGTQDGPVTVGTVVSDTGAKVGEVVADTGALTGGIVAGTTGTVGAVLDATLGKLLPTGRRRS